jgi:hypothetical protein
VYSAGSSRELVFRLQEELLTETSPGLLFRQDKDASQRQYFKHPISKRSTVNASSTRMRERPIQLASLRVNWPELERTIADASHRHDLGIVSGGEDFVRRF